MFDGMIEQCDERARRRSEKWGVRAVNLRALRVFVGLMDDGTLTRAAARMHLSQSAASRLLSLLEGELGAPLFLRERRRMVPLPAADALYPEAVRILAQTDALREVVRSDRPAPLRILCQTRLVPGLVVPAIARFAEGGTRMVRLETAPRRELARRALAGRHDIVVATSPAPVEGGHETTLATVPLGILLPRDHALAGADGLGVGEVGHLPYVALDETTVIRRVVGETVPSLPPPAIEVSTGSAAYRLVAAGLGFTFADRLAVEPELWDRVALVPWEAGVTVTIGAVRSGGDASPADAFMRVLKAVAAEGGDGAARR